MTTIINNVISKNAFSDSEKLASVGAIYKKDDRDYIKNYWPASNLNCFSKIHEKVLNEKLLLFTFTSFELMSAYRNGYSTNHVLIRVIEIGDMH